MDFAGYRDHRLQTIKPITLKRELSVIHNIFEVARREWGFPIKENPIDGLAFKAPDQRRERRLRPGELDRLIEAARSRRNPLIIPIIQVRHRDRDAARRNPVDEMGSRRSR